jgi:hypothetical protein
MACMDVALTITEIQPILDPVMSASQLRTLLVIAGIGPCGTKRTGAPGHPAAVYPAAEIMRAHLEEASRTARQFDGTDWIASALLARHLVRADAAAGAIWWQDGTRAEKLLPSFYGTVRSGPCQVPAHRVIWIAAEGEIPAGIQVNHINKRRWDNRRANLELVTHINNIWHAHGYPYLTTADEGRRSAVPLPPPEQPDGENQALVRVGGAFRKARGNYRDYAEGR